MGALLLTPAMLHAVGVRGRMETWSFDTFPRKDGFHRALLQWCKQPQPKIKGVLLCGSPGIGKTGLTVSVCQHIVHQQLQDANVKCWRWKSIDKAFDGRSYMPDTWVARVLVRVPVIFEPWDRLQLNLRSLWGNHAEQDTERRVRETLVSGAIDLMALDDVDVGGFSVWKEALLLQMLERVEAGRRLILTANCAPDALAEVLGERCADRLWDKTQFMIFHLEGRSLRRG